MDLSHSATCAFLYLLPPPLRYPLRRNHWDIIICQFAFYVELKALNRCFGLVGTTEAFLYLMKHLAYESQIVLMVDKSNLIPGCPKAVLSSWKTVPMIPYSVDNLSSFYGI